MVRSCSASSSAPTKCSGPGRRTEVGLHVEAGQAHACDLPLDEGVAGAWGTCRAGNRFSRFDPERARGAAGERDPEIDPGRPAQDVLRARVGVAQRAEPREGSGSQPAGELELPVEQRPVGDVERVPTSASVARYGSRISCGASGTSGRTAATYSPTVGRSSSTTFKVSPIDAVVLDRGDEGVGHVLDPCHRQHAPRARTQPPRSGELDAEQRVPELAAAVDEPWTDDGRAATPRGDELLLGQLHLCVFVVRRAGRPRSGRPRRGGRRVPARGAVDGEVLHNTSRSTSTVVMASSRCSVVTTVPASGAAGRPTSLLPGARPQSCRPPRRRDRDADAGRRGDFEPGRRLAQGMFADRSPAHTARTG